MASTRFGSAPDGTSGRAAQTGILVASTIIPQTPVDTAAIDAVGPTVGPELDDASSVLDELSRCLRPLLAGLPVEQRRAVEMIDLDGMPQAGAARREGVSLSGMKSRVQRGRRRLAELLGSAAR